ncbi:hypothetical protein CYMTET_28376, partial [Cymbomonas tetramitiformis]
MANEGLNILETSSVVESKGHLEVPCELLKDVQVTTAGEAADVMTALVLSECVYQESSSDGLRRVLNGTQGEIPGCLVDIHSVQQALPHTHHRYLVAAGGEALYLAFMGSKHARDWLTDANALQVPLWSALEVRENSPDAHRRSRPQAWVSKVQARSSDYKALVGVKARGYSPGHKAGRGGLRWTLGGLDGGPVERRGIPAVHKGFLDRSMQIPVLQLYHQAQRCQRRLVLCGHSLGGAVAVIATLKLLEQLGDIGP